MARPLGSVLRYVERLVGLPRAGDCDDGQLLDRFVQQRDESALATLLQRHGPLVWSVCQRWLPDVHDAEDAFQATFIVLTRKASSLERRPSLAAWLYEVAQRSALQARALAARRRQRERQAPQRSATDHTEPVEQAELKAVLDAELSQLPDRYRAPIVLCDLQGKTHLEAARELNVPNGSLSKRLARGRELLRDRLARRGVTASLAALPAMLAAQGARGEVPAQLINATHGLLASTTLPAGTHAGLIAEGVLGTMCFSKVKIVAALLVVAALSAAVGLAVPSRHTRSAEEHVAYVPVPEENLGPLSSQPFVQDGLAVTVTPLKAVFASNETIAFRVRFKNVGTKTFLLYPADLFPVWSYKFVDQDDVGYSATAIWRKPPGERNSDLSNAALAPGKSLETTATLGRVGNVVFHFSGPDPVVLHHLPPGRYRLTIRLKLEEEPGENKKPFPFWQGLVETKPVRFAVSDKKLPLDEAMAENAALVVRARRVRTVSTPRQPCDEIEVVEVLRDVTGKGKKGTLRVFRGEFSMAVPDRPCTVYLTSGPGEEWTLSGVSHVEVKK